MKINDVKHNHSLTDLLKVLIFSILMLLPFIDVGIRCAYVMFNKNANQSYYGETINQKSFTETTSFNEDKRYQIKIENDTQQISYSSTLYISDVSNISGFASSTTNNIQRAVSIRLYYDTALKIALVYDNNGTNSTQYLALDGINGSFEFNVTSFSEHTEVWQGLTYVINYNNYSYLDNVFNYSINQLTTNELYNWTTQTAIYTGVSAMTTQLGITGILIPMLVCYWFFITIIYIILDIVIKLFTMLTHAIGSKKA